MDFGDGMVIAKSKIRDGLTPAVIKYNEDRFFAVLNNGKEYNINAYEFSKYDIIYSKPTNSEYEHWSSKRCKIPNNNFFVATMYWATVKENIKVRGIIKDDMFIIKKMLR